MPLIIHIGFGKTGTSALQNDLFPHLAASGAIQAYNPEQIRHWMKVLAQRDLTETETKEWHREIDNLAGTVLLSSEALCEWDPKFWSRGANRNLKLFGKGSRIVITLREPKSYITSVYQQAVHEGIIRKPSDFLLNEDLYWKAQRYLRPGKLDAFPVDALNYREFVALYESRFEDVVVVPMEAIWSDTFLERVFSLGWQEAKQFTKALPPHGIRNRSYSTRAMKLALGRERLLNQMGLKSLSTNDRSLRQVLTHTTTPAYSSFRTLKPMGKLRALLPRLFHRMSSWRKLLQMTDKIAYKKYTLDNNTYLGRHLDENRIFYTELKRSFTSKRSAIGGQTCVRKK